MKTIMTTITSVFAGIMFSLIIQSSAGANPTVSADLLTLSCLEAGMRAQDRTPSVRGVRITRGPIIKIREGYEINVFYFGDDTGKLVAILEKGSELAETAHIKNICLNKKPHNAVSAIKGEIDITAHLGEPLNIRFHLNKKAGDHGYLGRTSWKVPASASLNMAGPYKNSDVPAPPQPGQYPSCLDPNTVTATGQFNEDLSFDFDNCLAPGTDTVTYVYDLYLVRKKNDGTSESYQLDPQIINHGQGNRARH